MFKLRISTRHLTQADLLWSRSHAPTSAEVMAKAQTARAAGALVASLHLVAAAIGGIANR